MFSAFSQLRELSLADTELQVLPDIQFPSLVTLSLVNVIFDAIDGPLRILESCPRILSLHLDLHGSAMLVPDENQGGSAPSLNIAPLLTSFTGHYEDAQIIFFNPLPDGRLRRISRLKIMGSAAAELLPSMGSAFERSEVGIGQDLLWLTIYAIFDRSFHMNEDGEERDGLLWVTWLRTIVEYCPKLRGLIIEIVDPETEYQYLDESDGWGPTLSCLKDLSVLKLPATLWQEEAALGGLPEVQGEQRAVERCLQWFPHLRLFFPADSLVLVIDPEENKGVNIPKGGKLLCCGGAMKQYWALYDQLFWNEFDEQIERLIARTSYPVV